MKLSESNVSGLILAAGESKRMGQPKALLAFGKTTLLARQTAMLIRAGCSNITVVVGADAEGVMKGHEELMAKWAVNDGWEMGQFSSIQIGARDALSDGPIGIVVLPVDTVGVRAETVNAIIETALRNPHLAAVIPEYEGKDGHPIYLSKSFCEGILRFDPKDEKSRLDMLLEEEPNVIRVPVNDAGIRRNINTIEEWDKFLRET